MNYAPVALFVYSRLSHTRQTLLALARCELALETDLLIFSDGPKKIGDISAVEEVRQFIRSVTDFKSIRIIERNKNLGLANSIIEGVTQVCNEFGRVIVMEDDLVVSQYFLQYMNDALNIFADEESVASIHGYWYPVDQEMPETFFLRGASCWGWATWSRAWQIFESDGRKLLKNLQQQKLTRSFDLDGAMAYTKMLKDQIAGKNNSWAIRWHAATYLENRLQLSPGKSLVRNIGFDGTGVHRVESEAYTVELAADPIVVKRLPPIENDAARAALIGYYRNTRRSLVRRVIGRLRRIVIRRE